LEGGWLIFQEPTLSPQTSTEQGTIVNKKNLPESKNPTMGLDLRLCGELVTEAISNVQCADAQDSSYQVHLKNI